MDNFLTDIEASLFSSITGLLDPINIIIGGISVFAATMVTAWALYQAMLIMTGQSSDSFTALMKDFFIKIFILSFVFGTAPNYKAFIADPAVAIVDGLSEELSGSKSVFEKVDEVMLTAVSAMMDMDSGSKEKDNATLSWWDKLWDTVTLSFGQIWKSINDFLKFTVIGIGALYMASAAFLIVIISKVFAYISLAVGPLFIFFAAFNFTRGWFQSWLSTTMGYLFTYVTVMIVWGFLLGLLDGFFFTNTGELLMWSDVWKAFLACFFLAKIVLRVGDLTSSWFGTSNITDGTTGLAAAGTAKAVGLARGVGGAFGSTGKATGKAGTAGARALKKRLGKRKASGIEEG